MRTRRLMESKSLVNRRWAVRAGLGLAVPVLVLVAQIASAVTSGPNFAGTASGWGATSSNATGVNDNVCASTGSASTSIDLTGFGFSLPLGATINGVTVEAKYARTSSGSGTTSSAQLIKAGGTLGTSKTLSGGAQTTCGSTVFQPPLGGGADLWGISGLTPADVDNSTFGVRITTGTSAIAYLADAVKITITYTADATNPVVTLNAVATPSNDNTPTFTGTGGLLPGDSSTVTVEVFAGPIATGIPVQTPSGPRDGTTGAYSITAAALTPDGTYTARAKQSDDSGNTGLSTARTFVIDTTPPAVSAPDLVAGSDSGSSSTDDITKDDSPTLTGTAESGASVALERDGSTVATGTATGGSWSLTDPGPVPDGTHSYTASATDGVGNTATSSGLSVAIDTAAPAVSPPDLDASSDSGSSSTDDLTNDDSPSFGGTAESGAAVELLRDATPVASGTATGGSWSLTDPGPVPDGAHSYTASATDTAGNTATSSGLSVTIDTAAPEVSPPDLDAASDTGSSDSDNITSDNSPSFSGTAEDGSAVELLRDGSPVDAGPATGGLWALADAGPVADGTYGYAGRATDLAGNQTTSADLSVTIDTGTEVGPIDLDAASDTGTSDTDNVTSDNSPSFSGTAEDAVTVTLLRDAVAVASGPVSGGTWSLTDPGPAPDGPHAYSADVVDAAGNTASSGTLAVTIDTVGPACIVDPQLVVVTALGQAVTGSCSDVTSGVVPTSISVTFTPLLAGTPATLTATCTTGCGAPGTSFWTVDTAGIGTNLYAVESSAPDVAGNAGALSPPVTMLLVRPELAAAASSAQPSAPDARSPGRARAIIVGAEALPPPLGARNALAPPRDAPARRQAAVERTRLVR